VTITSMLFVCVGVALLRQVVGWNAQSVIQSLSRTLISPKCGIIYFNDKQINVNGHARASFRHPSRLVISSTRLYNKRSIKDDGIKSDGEPPLSFRRALLASTLAATTELIFSQQYVRPGFKRLKPTRFIAALGDSQTSEGTGAESWGLWERDPGPRGIPFDQFDEYSSSNGRVAPTGWEIDNQDFWLEEHGIWMETPKYDLSPGKYLVTGGRYQTNVLTIYPRDDESGSKRWSLDKGVLYDVTHLPCRSARYIAEEGRDGSPLQARKEDFPVKPGAEMPAVNGCKKQDYAVLFVTGIADSRS